MTSAESKQVLREHELMREKLHQIFLDANHAYNYVHDNKRDEALTALSVVIMEIVTVLQKVEHQQPVVDPFSFKEEFHGNTIHSSGERRSLSETAELGRGESDRSSIGSK